MKNLENPVKMDRLICSVCDVAVFHERATRALWRRLRDAGWGVGVHPDGDSLTVIGNFHVPPISEGDDMAILNESRYKGFMFQMLREPMYEHGDGSYVCGGCMEGAVGNRCTEDSHVWKKNNGNNKRCDCDSIKW